MPGQHRPKQLQAVRIAGGRRVTPSSQWAAWPATGLHRLALSSTPGLGVGPPQNLGGGIHVVVELGRLIPEQQHEACAQLLSPAHPSQLSRCVQSTAVRNAGTEKAYLALALKPSSTMAAEAIDLDPELLADSLVQEGVAVELPGSHAAVGLDVRYRSLLRGPDQVVVKVTNLDPVYAKQGLLSILLGCAGYDAEGMVAAEFQAGQKWAPHVGNSALILFFFHLVLQGGVR